jgi:hypothetical protein
MSVDLPRLPVEVCGHSGRKETTQFLDITANVNTPRSRSIYPSSYFSTPTLYNLFTLIFHVFTLLHHQRRPGHA